MKTLQITILCVVLVLIGGCSTVNSKTTFESISVVEASAQPTASLTATASRTIAKPETKSAPKPMPTNTVDTHSNDDRDADCHSIVHISAHYHTDHHIDTGTPRAGGCTGAQPARRSWYSL